MDVYITETNLYGQWLYHIVEDGQTYDFFFSDRRLTWAEQFDVVDGYREGLDARR